MRYNVVVWCALLGLAACKKEKDEKPANAIPTINYSVKATWAHDTQAFTEGLEIRNGVLYESTGHEKTSWIGIVDINTGKTDKKIILEDQYFGEGMTILNNKIYQLTWTSKKGFVYDLKTYKRIGEFVIPTKEGWGMTNDGVNIIMSDGTDKLTYLDTASLTVSKTLAVTDANGPVSKLNELEYVDGYIYANQWETTRVVKIDVQTGQVVAQLDLSSLAENAALRNNKSDVANGIAYHAGTKLFVVTGKYWPSLYVLQLK